jgi:hypothetical protein
MEDKFVCFYTLLKVLILEGVRECLPGVNFQRAWASVEGQPLAARRQQYHSNVLYYKINRQSRKIFGILETLVSSQVRREWKGQKRVAAVEKSNPALQKTAGAEKAHPL